MRENRLHCEHVKKLNDPLEEFFIAQYLIGEETLSLYHPRTGSRDVAVGRWEDLPREDPKARDLLDAVDRKKICALSGSRDIV